MPTASDPDGFHENMVNDIRATGKGKGWFAQFDLLILHTIGAKSGIPRLNPMAYQKSHDSDEIFVFASNNGGPKNTGWYYNALAHPNQVSVEFGGGRGYAVKVREVIGTERDAIYARQAGQFENFARYQQQTTRTIPVLGLSLRNTAD